MPLTDADLNHRNLNCNVCHSSLAGRQLWPSSTCASATRCTSTRAGVRPRASPRASSQTSAASPLSRSGALMGSYSSTLFHLLYRFSPEIRTEFRCSAEHRWIIRYGFEEYTLGPLPPHRQHRLPQTRGCGIRPAPLRGAGAAVEHGIRAGRDEVLPAQRLRHGVQGVADCPFRRVPSACWRPTSRLCWPTPMAARGIRPPQGRCHRPDATPVRRRSSTPRRRCWWTWRRRRG